MTTARGRTVLTALGVAAAALIVLELALGAVSFGRPQLADPCTTKATASGGGIDATVQRFARATLDGAACQLHTTREELVLSLGGGSALGTTRRWDAHTIEVALRAGLLHSVDAAVQRGDVPGFLAPALRGLVERAPLGKLVRGGIGLKDLLG